MQNDPASLDHLDGNDVYATRVIIYASQETGVAEEAPKLSRSATSSNNPRRGALMG